MKNILLSIFLFGGILNSAQVGINTQTPDPSAALDIRATNKGVSFPKVALQSRTDIVTVPTRTESLLVYNTNPAVSGNKGNYFWDGAKWEYLFTDINQGNLMNHVKYYSSNSTTAYTFTRNTPNQFYGYTAHAPGEDLTTSTQWTVVASLNKTITIDRAQNEVLMNINGMYQANNPSNTTGGAMSTIGFFVDNKLVDVKPIYLNFTNNCSFRQFMIYGIVNNLSVGNHDVKFAIRNISAPNTTGLTVTFGGPNPSSTCNSLNSFETAISSTISINQPYVF